MRETFEQGWVRNHRPPLALVLGTNETASAVAVRLFGAGFATILSHDRATPVLRRGMAFHDALFGEAVTLGGLTARMGERSFDIQAIAFSGEAVAITAMGYTDLVAIGPFDLLVDARPGEGRTTPDLSHLAAVTAGIGPGFRTGTNCTVAIARPARDPDEEISGRFIRAAEPGTWRSALDVGARIFKGMILGHLGRSIVSAPMDGLLRGLPRDGTEIPAGAGIVEIDTRNRWQAHWQGLDGQGVAIGEAILSAATEEFIAARKAACTGPIFGLLRNVPD